MTVGERIKARRKVLGMNAETLADIIGVSRATMYRYENGDIEKVPVQVLGPIAEALNTTPAHLMGIEDDSITEANEPAKEPAPLSENEPVDYDKWLSTLSQDELLKVIAKATQALQERNK